MVETQSIGDYVTLEGAARMLDKTYGHVNWLVVSQKLPHIKVGRIRLVKLSDIERLRTEAQKG